MPVNPTDVVEYVRASQEALRKADLAMAEQATREKAAAAAAAEAKRALIEYGHVKAALEGDLTSALSSHEKTLLLMTKLAKKQPNQAPAAIGAPVDGVAEAGGAGRGAAPGGSGSEKTAADLAFERRIREAIGR